VSASGLTQNEFLVTDKGKIATRESAPADPQTSSHIPVRPLYTSADLEGWDYDRQVGYPGALPFTRGVQSTMYRGKLWAMCQYAETVFKTDVMRTSKTLMRQAASSNRLARASINLMTGSSTGFSRARAWVPCSIAGDYPLAPA